MLEAERLLAQGMNTSATTPSLSQANTHLEFKPAKVF